MSRGPSLVEAAGITIGVAENLVGASPAQFAAAMDAAVRADPRLCAALVDEAVRFLRCGSVILSEWVGLLPCERDALNEAAQTVLAERAAAHGYASLSEIHARTVGSKSDGGASLVDSLLSRAVDAITKKAPGEPSVQVAS